MVHWDNPEKAQYSIGDIFAHGGADLQELLHPRFSKRYALISEVLNFTRDNNIIELEAFRVRVLKLLSRK